MRSEISEFQTTYTSDMKTKMKEVDDLRAEFVHLAAKIENTQSRMNDETDVQIQTLGAALQELQTQMTSSFKKSKKGVQTFKDDEQDEEIEYLNKAMSKSLRKTEKEIEEIDERLTIIEEYDLETVINGLMARIEQNTDELQKQQNSIELE